MIRLALKSEEIQISRWSTYKTILLPVSAGVFGLEIDHREIWISSDFMCLQNYLSLSLSQSQMFSQIFPSTYMEAVALTVKATQARQH